MSSTLNLFDRLLDTACQMHQAGRTNDSFTYLTKLLGLRDLPTDVAVEAHLRLAEMLLKRQKPNRARKHAKAALRLAPEDARAHRFMAEAQEGGRLPDPYAAVEHYRRSLELQPEQADVLCTAGRLTVQQGLWEEGLGYLRKAAELATDNPDVLRKVVDGLLLANQADEARGLLRAALFRHSRDRRFRSLWDHFQFQQLRKEQGEAQARRSSTQTDDGPVLLPFEPRPEGLVRRKGKLVRHDPAAKLAAPHGAIVARMFDRRYAR
jgi:Tfp pilus assembly protein PilF